MGWQVMRQGDRYLLQSMSEEETTYTGSNDGHLWEGVIEFAVDGHFRY